jgi:hypothetical protein
MSEHPRVCDLFDEGNSIEEISRISGRSEARIRDQLRRGFRIDGEPTSIWELEPDDQRAEFTRRARRGAKLRLRELRGEIA